MNTKALYQILNRGKDVPFDQLTEQVVANPKLVGEMVELALSIERQIARNASYLLFKIGEQHPDLIQGHQLRIMETLPKLDHNSQVGMLLDTLRIMPYGSEEIGPVVEFAFNLLSWKGEYDYTKSSAIRLLDNVCEQEPDLARELVWKLEQYAPLFTKKYLVDCANEVLNKWKARL